MEELPMLPIAAGLSVVCVVLAIVLYRVRSANTSSAALTKPGGATPTAAAAKAGTAAGGAAGAPKSEDALKPLTVYYGSQTGTAEKFAKRIVKEARAHGFAGKLVDLEEFSPKGHGGPAGAAAAQAQLVAGGLTVWLMATYGEGEPTDNALEFHRWLTAGATKPGSNGVPAEGLAKTQFVVFGLGNRQYEHYNAMGKLIQARLTALGGSCVYPHGEGDDGADLEADFDAWLEGSGGFAATATAAGGGGGATVPPGGEGGLYQALRRAAGLGGASASIAATASGQGGAGEAATPAAPEIAWRVKTLPSAPTPAALAVARSHERMAIFAQAADRSSKHFFQAVPARVVVNRELRQAPGVGASTRHVEFELKGSGLSYTATDKDSGKERRVVEGYTTADNLYICPLNEAADVQAVAQALGYDLSAWIELEAAAGPAAQPQPQPQPHPIFPTPCTTADLLARLIDLSGAPDREVLSALAAYASGTDRARLLKASGRDAAGKAEYAAWITTAQRGFGEVLLECTTLHGKGGQAGPLSLEALVSLAPRMQARPYTISSSSAVQPHTVAVCASVIDTPKPGASGASGASSGSGGRRLKGVASNTLLRLLPDGASAGPAGAGLSSTQQLHPAVAALYPEKDGQGAPLARVYIRPSTFHLPADVSLPVVMIGPGTGIAPMRAFLHERRWQRAKYGEEAVGPTVLFFGCRHRAQDYIYQPELASFVQDGTLTALHLAFSREGPTDGPKRYVQHALAEEGANVWGWIRPRLGLGDKGKAGKGGAKGKGAGAAAVGAGGAAGGGSIFVCGATTMGHDVQAALGQIVTTFGPRDSDSAALLAAAGVKDWPSYLPSMQEGGRYIQELWSSA